MLKLKVCGGLSFVAALLSISAISCQEAAVQAISSHDVPLPTTSSPGTSSGATEKGTEQPSFNGIAAQVQVGEPNAAGVASGATPHEEADDTQEPFSAARPNTASSQNRTAVPTSPAAVVPDWSQFRFVFSTDVFGQAGGADALGKKFYLTSNPNFCVADPNLGFVDGTLDPNEIFLEIAFGAPIRGPYAGAWTGPGAYGLTPFTVMKVIPDPSFPGFCAIEKDGAAYSGNITVKEAENGVHTLTIKADLPTTVQLLDNPNANPTTVSVTYSLSATPCNFQWQHYQAFCQTGCAPYSMRPSGIWSPRCTSYPKQRVVQEKRVF